MKTSELIKLLQKVDPSGDLHVHMANGAPCGVYVSPANYDGHHHYVDCVNNKPIRYVYSEYGDKVVIDTIDECDFVWSIFETYTPYTYPTFGDVLRMFVHIDRYGVVSEPNEALSMLRKLFDHALKYHVDKDNEDLKLVCAKMQDGWLWLQNKNGNSFHYTVDDNGDEENNWTILDDHGKSHIITECDINPICYSGLFKKTESDITGFTNDKFWKWIIK